MVNLKEGQLLKVLLKVLVNKHSMIHTQMG